MKHNENKTSGIPWKWILLGMAVAGMAVASRVLPLGEWLVAVSGWIDGLGHLGLVVFVLLYIAATLLFLPGLVFSLGAGALFGLGWGFAAASVGSTIGAACAFLVGRHIARDRVAAALARRPQFRAIDRAVGENGWKIVGLLRLSPILPFNLQNYFYGITSIGFWPYVAASWIGMMPGTLLYVYLGAAGRVALAAAAEGDVPRDPLQTGFFIAGLVATVIVTIHITQAARNVLKNAEADVVEGGEP